MTENILWRDSKPYGDHLMQKNSKNVTPIAAVPVPMAWDPSLSIFASESFLKAVSDEYGWLGGVDEKGELRCVLPYTIIRKLNFRLVRFRVETILLDEGFTESDEKSFLNSAISYFRSIGADIIIPATTNTIFRTYPDGAKAAPYGSYTIDLTKWRPLKDRSCLSWTTNRSSIICLGLAKMERS
jgi:hypothetical protein